MHPNDFMVQNPQTQFPNSFEQQKRAKLNVPDITFELQKDRNTFFSFDTSLSPPPYSTTSCFITETQNTDPTILRSTMYKIPNSSSLFDAINIPLSFLITPFTDKAFVNEAHDGTKCHQCGSYANLFSKLYPGGFTCNICSAKNSIDGLRQDLFSGSSMDYLCKNETSRHKPKVIDSEYFRTLYYNTPSFLFVIDTSNEEIMNASILALSKVLVSENFTFLYKQCAIVVVKDDLVILKPNKKKALNALDDAIENVSLDETTKSRETEDGSNVNVDPCDSVSELIIFDSETPYIPPNVFFDLEDEAEILGLIDYLKNMAFTPTKHASYKNIVNVLLHLSYYSVASKTAMLIRNFVYPDIVKLATKFIEARNSVSIFTFLHNTKLMEEFSVFTTGTFKAYAASKFQKLQSDLFALCTMKSSFGVHVEVKTSDAIRKSAIYANTVFENLSFIDFAQMDANTSLMFSFYVEESVAVNDPIYAQVIIDYYAFDGSKRVLVLNNKFIASNKVTEIFNSMSFDTIFSAFAKFISSDMKEITANSNKVEQMICRCLKYYRDQCCKTASPTQFVLPESLKLIPVLYQSLLKNNLYTNFVNYLDLRRVVNFNAHQTLRFFYPRLWSFADYYIEQDINKVKDIRLSLGNIESGEIYIMENGIRIYVYIGRDIDESLKLALFSKSDENKILFKLVNDTINAYGYDMPVVVIEENKGGVETEFLGYMVEDKLNDIPAYSDYVCQLHFKVQKA